MKYLNSIFHWVITELFLFREHFLSTQSQETASGSPPRMRSWFLDHANELLLSPRALIIMAHTKLLCLAVLSQRDDACRFTLLHSHLLASFFSTFSPKAVLATTKYYPKCQTLKCKWCCSYFWEHHIFLVGHGGLFLLVSLLEFWLQFCKYHRYNQIDKMLIKTGIWSGRLRCFWSY